MTTTFYATYTFFYGNTCHTAVKSFATWAEAEEDVKSTKAFCEGVCKVCAVIDTAPWVG